MSLQSNNSVTPSSPACLRVLSRALAQNAIITNFDYATLATVRANRLPAARTVWIRALHNDHILLTTDRRSDKVSQLGATLQCQLCWYLPMMKEQFRFSCSVTVVDSECSDDAWQSKRAQLWRESPDWLRISFAQPLAPGQALTVTPPPQSQPQARSSSDEPHENFVLLALSPVKCDYLRLPVTVIDNSKPLHRESLLKPQKHQQRWLYTKDPASNEWKIVQLHP